MTKYSYNAITEPWIGVVDLSNRRRRVGIQELLEHAHELLRVEDASPPMEFGTYRMLVALVMDIYQIQTVDDVIDLRDNGKFDTTKVGAYLSKWKDRFDLFHDKFPFYQAPVDGREGMQIKSVAELLFQFPQGNNPLFFSHYPIDYHAVSPAVALKALLSIPPFMTVGGAGYSPGINGAPPWYVLIRGKNLFDTLVLNCCGVEIPQNSGDAPPCWRNDEPVVPKETRKETSTLEGMTWRPRYIRLVPGEGGTCTYSNAKSDVLIRDVIYGPGFKWGGDFVDPSVAYRQTKKGSFPVRPSEGKPLWQDTGALALLKKDYWTKNGISYERPAIVSQAMELLEEDEIRLSVYGLRVDKAKIFEWQLGSMHLPMPLIVGDVAAKTVQDGIFLVDSVSSILRRTVKKLDRSEGKSNKAVFDRVIEMATRSFWNRLEPRFNKWIWDMARDKNVDLGNFEDEWKSIVKEEANATLDTVFDQFDSRSDFLKRQVEARSMFNRMTYKMLKTNKATASATTGKAKGGVVTSP